MIRASVVGAAGYVGGELLRLLLGHPRVGVARAVSTSSAGRRVDSLHPNLRGHTDLSFSALEDLDECDVLLLATPHTATMELLPKLAPLATQVIDLSADFRLRDPEAYASWYGTRHAAPELLAGFVPGLPELDRAALVGADRVSVPGCMATAAVLALLPLAEAGLIEPAVVVDARTGSSGAGRSAGEANLHPERSGAMRVFAPAGHRHQAEVAELTGLDVTMTATGVEAVRGVQVICHAKASRPLDDRGLRRAYRERYAGEPFVRVVTHRGGTYRYPEPKILSGSNHCDVGFAAGPDGRVVAVAALDNLRMGWPETEGLGFPGLHPA